MQDDYRQLYTIVIALMSEMSSCTGDFVTYNIVEQ